LERAPSLFNCYFEVNITKFHWFNTITSKEGYSRDISFYKFKAFTHLPRYLAEFCFRFNNRFYVGGMIGNLIKYAANNEPILLSFITLAEQKA
jgi:hypothetical protein